MKVKQVLMGSAAAAVIAAVGAVTLMGVAGAAPAPAAAPIGGKGPTVSCDSLAATAFADAKVDKVEAVPAGAFTPPAAGAAAGPGAPRPMQVPAFCRVSLTLTPSADSDIKSEVWLPTNWNGKFMEVGNGGWAGSISYAAMGPVMERGYAVASTDTGHVGARGTFGYQHPEKFIDFAWRSVHETAVKSKALVAAYYGAAPRLSYWNGCSTGGKQGLKEVQKFPADFDGVIAGAPANNWVRLQTQSLAANIANLPKGGAAGLLGAPQLSLLHDAVIAKCDTLDGVKDNEVEDPRQCDFKAASLVCKPGQAAGQCLTTAQAEAADKIYAAVRDSKGGLIYPGSPPTSELSWAQVISRPWQTGVDEFADAVFNDPNWDFYTLNLDTDVIKAEKADLGILATDPDLSAFKARGGKIIQYHGWSDPLISTENSINYYESVVAKQGGLPQTQAFYRLFLVPAMGHCNGAYTFDWITPIEDWVEHNKAPDIILGDRLPQRAAVAAATQAAVNNAVVNAPNTQAAGPATPAAPLGKRPMCVYPTLAKYKGAGDINDPASYSCAPAARGARPSQGPAKMGDRVASL